MEWWPEGRTRESLGRGVSQVLSERSEGALGDDVDSDTKELSEDAAIACSAQAPISGAPRSGSRVKATRVFRVPI